MRSSRVWRDSSSPTERGASRERSSPAMRAAISSTSFSSTSRFLARRRGVGSMPRARSFSRSLARLKKSLRWAWVVPSFTSRQFSMRKRMM